MIKVGFEPILECSSKNPEGDKRFSAFYARIAKRGNRTIEEIYQASKVFKNGDTGLSIQSAKGRAAVNMTECAELYSLLWDEYFEENPDLYKVIARYRGFSDIFGKAGSVCQANEVYRHWIKYAIRNTETNSVVFSHMIGNMRDKDITGDDVYCGRGNGSEFGNPYTHLPNIKNTTLVGSVDEAVAQYRYHLINLMREPSYKAKVLSLKGKKLYCWCKGLHNCHLYVLVGAANHEW